MFYTMIWLLMALLLALWSAAAWVMHALAQWSGLQAGGMSGLPTQVGALPAPEWLSPWLPPGAQESWTSALAAFTPMINSMVDFAPVMLALLVPAIWLIWAIGAVLLVVLGLGLTLLIRLIRTRQGATAASYQPLVRQ
jgi:hypothetical protein